MEDTHNGTEQKQKVGRTRSPAYPAINLEVAVKRAKEFYAHERRNASTLAVIVSHWGFAEKSSGGLTTAAALKSFGLMRDLEASTVRRVQLTDLALRIVLDDRPDSQDRAEALKKAALLPKMHIFLWNKYGPELPSDANLRHELIFDWKFNENAVSDFIHEYRQTISFANLTESDKLSISVEDSNADRDQEEEMESAFAAENSGAVKPPAIRQRGIEPEGVISTPVGKDEDRVVFAHVRFDGGIRKEFVASLKKYLEYLETTLQ